MDSLFAPLGPLSPHLEPYRFWIWLQMVALRLYVRALKGRGVPFMTVIDHRGTVYLQWNGDAPHEREPDPLAFTWSKAFRLAIGELKSAHPGEHRDHVRLDAGEPSCQMPFSQSYALPGPDP